MRRLYELNFYLDVIDVGPLLFVCRRLIYLFANDIEVIVIILYT